MFTQTSQPGKYGSDSCEKLGRRVHSQRSCPAIWALSGAVSAKASPVEYRATGSSPFGYSQSPAAAAAAGRWRLISSGLPSMPPVASTTASAVISSSPAATPVTAPSVTISRSTRCFSARSTFAWRLTCASTTSMIAAPPCVTCPRGTSSSPEKYTSRISTPRSASHSIDGAASSASRLTTDASTFHWLRVM